MTASLHRLLSLAISSISRSLPLLALLVVWSASSSRAQAYKVGSPDAYALSVELRSGDTERIEEALKQFPNPFEVYDDSLILADMDVFVEDGLISALESQLDYFESEVTGDMAEHFYQSVIDPLVLYVSRIEDEKAIPVLLRALERNNMASLGLAWFGPEIIPVILDYMRSPERTMYQIRRAFEPLRFIANIYRPLSAEYHATLKQLAIDCMQGYISACLSQDSSPYSNKYYGSALASTLGDPDLKEMVIDIADEIPGFFELDMKYWYDPNQDATDRDQLAPND